MKTKIKIAPSVDKGRILIRIVVTVSMYMFKGLRMMCESHISDTIGWTRPHIKGAALIFRNIWNILIFHK